MLEIEIDGRQVQVPQGSTIMDATRKLGIYVPHFCYHEKLSIAANCRMCLVHVEKAPKPVPACATPATHGMKVYTHSETATEAQKGVMEFLLINHPLDCPICDQGGECQLQDLAVGYGKSASRYEEPKRVVVNKNLGPLISTDMTRCIHCTRCVRFGEEIAGIMELGMAGRGEHAEIMAFVGRTVDSELSGNVIDLCPVGALTSKPFRYTARTWELARRPSISPHCGLGSNLTIQTKQNRVMRVLPRENEEINECWLSDKDRFAYEGLNAPERLLRPMLKQDGQWREVEWSVALDHVAQQLRSIVNADGAHAVGALATPHSTFEELYLLQKLVRGLGTGNVDFRLRQSDFRADVLLRGAPWLGMPIAEFAQLDRALVIGSFLRKDHPLLAHRLRQAAKRGAQISFLNPVDDDHLIPGARCIVAAPDAMAAQLTGLIRLVAAAKGEAVPAAVAGIPAVSSDALSDLAARLQSGARVGLFLGNMAQHHPAAAELHGLTQILADLLGARFGFLGEAANSVGGYLAGAVPFGPGGQGLDARQMLAQPRKAYLLFNVEPELDAYNPAQALQAMAAADLVVAFSAYRHRAADYADVLLPIAPFSETHGSFVSTEGRVQSFQPAVQPAGEARPGWKVLRVLANRLGLAGFEFDAPEQITAEIGGVGGAWAEGLDNSLPDLAAVAAQTGTAASQGVQRIADVPIYQADAIVRRAASLQKSRDAAAPRAWMNAELFRKLGLSEGGSVGLRQSHGEAVLPAAIDDRLPDRCIRVPAGHPLTASLGGMFDGIEIWRESAAQSNAD